MRLNVPASLAVVAITGFSSAAFAHAHLKSALPAVDAAVTAVPDALELHFSEAVDLAFTGVQLSGPGEAADATGKASLKGSDDTTLIVPVNGKLHPGTYTVSWHALSRDGHKTAGTYRFTIK